MPAWRSAAERIAAARAGTGMLLLQDGRTSRERLDFCLFAVDTYRAVRHSNPIVLASLGLKYIELSAIDGVRVLRIYFFATTGI